MFGPAISDALPRVIGGSTIKFLRVPRSDRRQRPSLDRPDQTDGTCFAQFRSPPGAGGRTMIMTGEALSGSQQEHNEHEATGARVNVATAERAVSAVAGGAL